jgi:hypothetical protein
MYGSVLLQTTGVVLFNAAFDIFFLRRASFSGVIIHLPSAIAFLTPTEIFKIAFAIRLSVSFVNPLFQELLLRIG